VPENMRKLIVLKKRKKERKFSKDKTGTIIITNNYGRNVCGSLEMLRFLYFHH